MASQLTLSLERCGQIVKCYDFIPRPCLRIKGHPPGCNPFSADEQVKTNDGDNKSSVPASSN